MSNQDQRDMANIHKAFNTSSAHLLYAGRQMNKDAYGVIESKMVRGENTREAVQDKDLITNPQHDVFLKSSIAKSIERIRDNQNILQLLPDIKQTIEIIIGTVLSPKDMMNPTLTFKSNNAIFDDTAGPLLAYVQDYFVSSYKLEDQLTDMLWDILGKTGSYPIAVLPETAVDYMINSNSRVTLEDINGSLFNQNGKLAPLGLIGDRSKNGEVSNEEQDLLSYMKTVALESYVQTRAQVDFDPTLIHEALNLTVVDNFDALKIPRLKNKVATQVSHDIIQARRKSIGLESIKLHRQTTMESVHIANEVDYTRATKDQEKLNTLYPDRQFTSTPIMRVRTKSTLSKETVGHPLIIKLPTEATIPVFNPMNPREHVGYFVMIDPTGNALRLTEMDNLYKMLQTSSNAGSSNALSYLVQQSQNALGGSPMDLNSMTMAEGIGRAAPVFQQLVERDLLDRINRGAYGTGLHLGNTDTAMLIMLSRALQGKHTQMLFVPASLLSYLAIDYDEYGLGKTLLDDSKLLAALRSMNMVVNSIASSKNAITKRILNADLDPAEKNPQKAMQIIMQEYVKGTQSEYPLTNNPVDQINYLQMAGVQVNVGDHPRLPSTKVGVDYIDNQYKQIDVTWDEWLKKLHTQATGLSPEVVEGAGSADFATQTVLANVLSARRVDMISRKFTASLSGFIQTYTYNSQVLFDGLVELIESNKIRLRDSANNLLDSKDVAVHFIESIEVALPPPDTTKVKEQKEAFAEQEAFYTDAIKHFFSSEFLTEDDLGRLGGMDQIQKHEKFIISYFMRNWMKENGIMTELFDMVGVDRHGKPLIDFNEKRDEYMESLAAALMPMMKKAMKRSGNINAEMDKYEEGLTNPPAESEGGSGFDSTTPSDDSGDSFEEGDSGEFPDMDTEFSDTETSEESTEEESNDDEGNPDEEQPAE